MFADLRNNTKGHEGVVGVTKERLLLVLAGAFVFVNALAWSLVAEGRVVWGHVLAPAGWLVIVVVGQGVLERYCPGRDRYLFPLVSLLTGWGIVLLDRLAPNFLWRQLLWLTLGTSLMLAVAVLPRSLRLLRRYRYTWLIAGLLLLLGTILFGVNPSGFGPTLWVRFPFLPQVYFQPSELLKLLLIVFLASYFDEREQLLALNQGRVSVLAYLAPLAVMWGLCIVLLVWQRDLGAAMLFFVMFLALLYLATGEKGYVLGGAVMLLVAGVIGYYAFDVVALRIEAWWNPWPDADNRAYQIVQSLYAVAAGGIGGQGIGQGFPDYIPVVHSDFVFAAIAEEWGLIGSLGIVGCFALLAHRGLRIAAMAGRSFGLYLAAGITILFSMQALLIMAGVAKLMPLTGVTLPFVSYGGSSLLMSFVLVGLLVYLSDRG